LQASGLGWISLRNALYAEFQLPDFQGAIATGKLVSNQGEGRTTYISRADCAAAAAGALLSDTENVTYEITGTELLSPADKAALASELAGEPVELVLVDDDAFIAGLQEHGIPAEGAQVIASFGRAIREGYLDQLTDAVEQLAGRPPRSLRDVVAPALAS
jgi:NAD(P)H dehydrogenase (quinone)